MQTSEAVDYLNSLTWHPGWKVVAEDATDRFQSTIRVRFTLTDARRSEREFYPRFYVRIPGGAKSAFLVPVGDVTSHAQLLHRVTMAAVENFTHEWREFAREAVTGHAPIHPHTIDGMTAWSEVNGTPVASDLTFGLA